MEFVTGSNTPHFSNNHEPRPFGVVFPSSALGGWADSAMPASELNGCIKSLVSNPKIKVLSDNQDGKCRRDDGMNIMQGQLIRSPRSTRCSRSVTQRLPAVTLPLSSWAMGYQAVQVGYCR